MIAATVAQSKQHVYEAPLDRVLEDPLSYLPITAVREFKKGATIIDQVHPSTGLYLIVAGKVAVHRRPESGERPVLVNIYQEDDFFGESALTLEESVETAIALEPAQLMTWTTDEINGICANRPKLGIALLQFIVQRSHSFQKRIESLASDGIERRLGRTLLEFSERFGEPTDDGRMKMIPLTHQLLAEYVGTSREIITHFMAEFREKQFIDYSRRETVVKTASLTDLIRRY
jgi:CRP/FNR family transcriptional regulator, cyclic AMP receptor protein